MNNSYVSIGMPVYNGAAYIRQAIDSLLAQTHQNFELIISDNGSNDETQEICRQYALQDKRIKFYVNEVNLGALSNFTKVLEIAQYDYFMWAAHDDIWESEYISALVSIMEKDAEVAIAFTMFDAINESNQMIVEYPTILDIPSDDLYQRLAKYIKQHERLGKANPFYALMRKKYTKQAFATAYPLLQKGVWASDMLFIFQMLSLGKFVVSPQKLFHKRIITASNNNSVPEDWHSYFNGYQYLISQSEVLNYTQKVRLLSDVFYRRKKLYIDYPLVSFVSKLKSIIKSLIKKVNNGYKRRQ
ncbi:MAG: glycosyltransferase [Pseudanabaenaceae cyanobacterium bins.39]|nr:glycosyltransferase [Pseudanabaenaceae cyanobacterium bins.39]